MTGAQAAFGRQRLRQPKKYHVAREMLRWLGMNRHEDASLPTKLGDSGLFGGEEMLRSFSASIMWITAGALALLLVPAATAQDVKPRPGNQPPKIPPPNASAAHVSRGFRVEIFLKDLTYPTSVEFDDQGNLYVAEAGYSYGDPAAAP